MNSPHTLTPRVARAISAEEEKNQMPVISQVLGDGRLVRAGSSLAHKVGSYSVILISNNIMESSFLC